MVNVTENPPKHNMPDVPELTPAEIWNLRSVKQAMQQEYYDWLAAAADWKLFITLTCRDFKSAAALNGLWGHLLQVLNTEVFGGHYTRLVGHSYFNYLKAMEAQQRGALHLHVLVDKPVHFDLLHSWWKAAAGFALIKKVDDKAGAIAYVTKYILKGGDENLEVFLKAPDRQPRQLPIWWLG